MHYAKISGNFGPKCKWNCLAQLEIFRSKWSTSRGGVLLLFTWANWLLHSLGKWCAKFRTGKFRPRITFTICTNQFHLPKNSRKGLNWYIKDKPDKPRIVCLHLEEALKTVFEEMKLDIYKKRNLLYLVLFQF